MCVVGCTGAGTYEARPELGSDWLIINERSRQAGAMAPLTRQFDDHPRVISFLCAFMCLCLAHSFAAIVDYRSDAALYWALSSPAAAAHIDEVVRGYLYPLLLRPMRTCGEWIGSPFFFFRLVGSMIYAYVLTGPVADLFGGLTSRRPTFSRRVAIALLPFALYPGLFLYPLSDLPAVVLALLAIHFCVRATGARWWLMALLAGAAVSAAYNVRTIYLFAFPILLVLLPFRFMVTESWRRRLLAIVCFLGGALAVAAPQMAINLERFGTATPILQVKTSKGYSLMASQLFWGVTIQRYETSIRATPQAYGIYYVDPAGVALRNIERAAFAEPSISGYVSLAIHHPLALVSVVGRHLVNGLDVRDGMVYEKRKSSDRDWMSLLCALVVWFSVMVCISGGVQWGTVLIPLSPVLAAVVAILPGAIETRFLFPFYLTLLGVSVVLFEASAVSRYLYANWRSTGAALLLWIAAFFAVVTSTMASASLTLP